MDLSSIFSLVSSGVLNAVMLIIALSIIVAIHEYGHYIVGRWCGIKADVFSLGFGKPLMQRTDKRGTVWQVAALPLGGYVKFAGDANAASAPDASVVRELSDEERRHTMPGAPLWARTLTVAAGPVFNFILSSLIFVVLILSFGQIRDRLIVDEVRALPFEHSLQSGDEILEMGGFVVPPVAEMAGFINTLPHENILEYKVLRDGVELNFNAPHPQPAYISDVSPRSAARAAGLKIGDVIIAADTIPLPTFSDLQNYVIEADGAAMLLTVWRDGETFETSLEARRRDIPLEAGGFETRWLIGVSGAYFFTPATEAVPFFDAVTSSITQVWSIVKMSVSAMGHMITGAISTCNMSGAIGMAQFVGSSDSVLTFFSRIAVMSTAIGMLNLFPIPVLDGGHLVFYAYEAVRGKPLPEKAVGFMMTFGMILILSIMVLGLGSDLFCK